MIQGAPNDQLREVRLARPRDISRRRHEPSFEGHWDIDSSKNILRAITGSNSMRSEQLEQLKPCDFCKRTFTKKGLKLHSYYCTERNVLSSEPTQLRNCSRESESELGGSVGDHHGAESCGLINPVWTYPKDDGGTTIAQKFMCYLLCVLQLFFATPSDKMLASGAPCQPARSSTGLHFCRLELLGRAENTIFAGQRCSICAIQDLN